VIYTKHNHLNYWYNNNKTNLTRPKELSILHFELGNISRAPETFRQECVRAATEIYQLYPDIHIGLTGGLNSNVCLESFLLAGHKPGVFIIEFTNQLNSFDSAPAQARCRELGITPKIITVDPVEFLSSAEFDLTVNEYQLYASWRAICLYAAKQLSVPQLFVDEIEIRRDVDPNVVWSFSRGEGQDLCWRRYSQQTGTPVLSNFFTWSPEQILAYVQLPTVQDLVADRISGKLSSISSRHKIYAEGGFEKFARLPKTWGIERIYTEWQISQDNVDNITIGDSRSCYVGHTELIEALTNKGGQWKYI
jgi:hypothetical protein